ncbi:hypothetical protein [Siminovitchia fortis]|uniref:hypothetical protein n=1 Tax=Siminovitchia fortis TaxID=254758 RepID=UPI0016426B35|nr:hypothetical protein [Siminovitchia fortis]
MDKRKEFLIILATSILVVFTLYIFRGFIPTVNSGKDTGQFLECGQNFVCPMKPAKSI